MTTRMYRKLITAAVGIAALLANRYLGWDILGIEPMAVDAIIGVLTLAGVERFTNEAA